MKFLAIATAAAGLAGSALAYPPPRYTHVTFKGAADAQYERDIPKDKSMVWIGDPLSVTYINVDKDPWSYCIAYGIDGSVTYASSGTPDKPVGPPQTQLWISCF